MLVFIKEKSLYNRRSMLIIKAFCFVGVPGFEPGTPCSQRKEFEMYNILIIKRLMFYY